MVTSVLAGPLSSLMASLMGRFSVSVPSMVSTVSPAITPALKAGESSSGVTMCRRLFSISTSAPMPVNSLSMLSVKPLRSSGLRNWV